jgi:beta-galactosidase GanA
MSRAFIGNSSQEIDEYRESLTKVLRDGNMSEFEDIAKAIVDFRTDRASKECRILDWHKFKSKKR